MVSYQIGIDAGVMTGYAIAKDGKLIRIGQGAIHHVMDLVKGLTLIPEPEESIDITVVVEDARKRKWFGKDAQAKMQGAGSIKRDCKIWEDFLIDLGVTVMMVHPLRGGTKLSPETFQQITGIETKKTQGHARDAAMLLLSVINKKA